MNNTVLFQGKEIDMDENEQHDGIHRPDHYTWKGKNVKK